MKFSLISDMHVDHPQPKTPYDLLEKNVIIAGDTSNGLGGLKFLQKLRNKGFNTYAIDGNHEHYTNVSQGRTPEETVQAFRKDNPQRGQFEGIPIIGCNGWYEVKQAVRWDDWMNDHRAIFGKDTQEDAHRCTRLALLAFLNIQDQLIVCKDKCIVVTHTAPCRETLDPTYDGHYSNEWYHNPFMNNLLGVFKDKILVWCHGHTHHPNDKMVNGVRVVCNPRGYPGENPDWKPLTIEV